MRRRSFRDARCLITGGSSGLGQALVLALARAGARVVYVGRNAAGLEEARRLAAGSPGTLQPVQGDLTLPGDRARLRAAVDEHLGGALDLVVNSAGAGAYGRFESHDDDLLRRLFEINVLALAAVCRLCLPCLRRGEGASLVNIGSIVARRALPGRSEYSATKHAVAALTEALRAEWKIDGIHVLLVNPGWTNTPFERNALVDTAFVKTAHRRSMTADQVAEATLTAILRRRNEITLSAQGRMLLLANRLSPRFVDWGLGRWTRRLYGRSGLGPAAPP